MPDDPDIHSPAPIPSPTPTGFQRTRGGGVKWLPPSAEHLGQLLPQYDIECLLGHGGMGAVYKGKQRALDRPVAIKILPPEVDDEDASYTQRFKNEAKIMGRMSHPAIVPVYDFGETSEGQFFFIMEFIDGTDVSKMIQQQGRLPPEHALAITAHVCDALKYAHEHGVIHRDIKPANVLINMEGAVKVADFGLAKVDDPSQNSGLTKSGMLMGTPNFIAPETFTLGMDVDGRADLYAVGVMLYQMLTGKVPRGSWRLPSVQVSGIDPRFDPIVSKAMEIDREDRYQTAGEFRRALDVILTTPVVKEGGESSAAIPKQSLPPKPVAKGPQQPMGKSANVPVRSSPPPAAADASVKSEISDRKSKTPLLIGIAAVVAIAIGAFVFSSSRREEAQEPSAAAKPNQSLVTSAATGVPSVPIKVREEPKPAPVIVSSTSQTESPKTEPPKPAPEKKAEPKPVATAPAPPPNTAPAKEGPQLARIPDQAKWVKAFNTPEALRPVASMATWTPDGIRLNGTLMLGSATDASVRASLRLGTETFTCSLRRRSHEQTLLAQVVAKHSEVTIISNTPGGKKTIGSFSFGPVPAGRDDILLAFTVVGDVAMVEVDGKQIGSVTIEESPGIGEVGVFSSGGLIRDIAWQSLDVPSEEKLAAAKAMEQEQLAQTVVTIPELATLDEQFKKLTAERVTAPFEADVAKLNSGYLGGLDRKRAEEKAAGHLDSVLALEAEKQLVQGAGAANSRASGGTWQVPLPEDDATSTTTPAVLKGLRQIYREAYAKIEATRAANMKALTDPLTTRLKLLESDLTKKDRIADAKTVKGYREGLQGAGVANSRPAERDLASPAPSTSPTALKDGFTNSLGMKFVKVPGTDVLSCIHETRRQDYAVYANEVPGVVDAWKNRDKDGIPIGDTNNHPVGAVTFEDAMGFCAWLSKKEKRRYRLPTDKEWSYAVGIGREERWAKDTTPEMLSQKVNNEFPWGDDFPPKTKDQAGNYSDTAGKEIFPSDPFIDGYMDGFASTAPIMSFKPNKIGIYDMGGNVWEWVDDWINAEQKDRVLRGASFRYGVKGNLLSSYRLRQPPAYRNNEYGFRVVVDTRTAAPASITTTKPGATTPPPPVVPPPAPATAAKSDFSNSLGMKFVKVPGTQVLFCIHETRYKDYAVYAADAPGVYGGWKDQSADGFTPAENKEDHPVTMMNWDDSKAFCVWLSKKESRTYRLPTDKEWSYAVGIGREEKWTKNTMPESLNRKVTNEFPWGSKWPPPKGAANYADTAFHEYNPSRPSIEGYTDGFPTTSPVMSFEANKLGLYDLGGNLTEWIEDWLTEAQAGHVLRGGSYRTSLLPEILSSSRGALAPGQRDKVLGFRIVVELTAP